MWLLFALTPVVVVVVAVVVIVVVVVVVVVVIVVNHFNPPRSLYKREASQKLPLGFSTTRGLNGRPAANAQP